jgi:class 3 adenylate cyclase/ketosteroid isomerase-like protein
MSCGHVNPERAKFCLECGAALAPRCGSCGAEITAAAKFCGECGAGVRVPATPSPVSARKVVTILFADLAGSTALHEHLDPESVTALMESYYQAMRGAVEAHRGTVVKFLGDGVMAAFGVPRVAEDDALRAVRAGVAIVEAVRGLGVGNDLSVRVALNTGEVVVNADNTDIVGDPVSVAARLQQEARNGDVVLGESTHRLVATLVTLSPLGSVTLKGRAEAVKAYRVESLERPAGAGTVAFVGRAAEIARLEAAYATAAAKPAAGLAVLLGSPGLGKSRLIDEFARRCGEGATVIRAHCDAAGGATFAPLAEALRKILPESNTVPAALEAIVPGADAEHARIVAGIAALLAGSPASPEETFFIVRRFLAGIATTKPVVLVIDDLQWAEPLLLDLVEHLVQWGSGVPLLVLVGARPELRDLRSSLVTPGGLVGDVLTLAGLDAGAAMRLAANVIGAEDLPAAVAAKVLATSEGNPLFVGELVRMLVQEGALTKEGDRWIPGVALAALEMPPTIHALLAARIERLRPEERTVLERAAVVGRHFSRSAVAALLSRNGSELDARLEALRRGELIERDTGWFLGEPVLRFHHLLIRDAAYRRLLKGTRAELHARFADWVAARAGDTADHDETIGWHLEQAHQLLRELGPLDEAGRALGARAAQHLAAAGRRALGRDDLPVAADLLGRAVDRLDVGDAARADLALDWCEALLSAGDVGPAAAAIAELGRFTEGSERLRAWRTCFASQLTVLTAPQELQAAADAVAEAAEQLTTQGDAAGEAKAHSVHAQALARLGKVGACEAALDQALAAARRAGDRRRANAVLAGAPLAALWGPSPVTRASGRCLDVVRVLRITQGAPAVESVALSCQGVLEALRGRTEAARRMLASSRKMVEDLGIAHRLFEADVFAGRIAAMEGDAAAAERLLRGAYEGLRDLGLGIDAARAGALLARTLLAQDRVAEAETLSHESEALAGDDLQAAIAWRGVRAEALAKRGEHAAAIEMAKAAVAIASATDALLDHADARVALSAALRAAGRDAEADAEERRAVELWEAKGAVLLAERARSDRGRVAPVAVTAADPVAAPPVRRRVWTNAATASTVRVEAAVAARDTDALASLFSDSVEFVDHPIGASYGRDGMLASLDSLVRSRNPRMRHELLATLGESLALHRRWVGASGTDARNFDVAAYDREDITVAEVDEHGRGRYIEVFATDHLGDAIARFYQRYAELLPEGPERERAAATAGSLGIMLTAHADVERVATVIAPEFESVDHRPLSTWSLRGGGAFLEHVRALREVATDVVILAHDVLALEPNALLVRRMHSGTERVGGGAYERPFLVLFATDAAGLLARAEWFDADREGEALARFDTLVARAEPQGRARRPVRPNATTVAQARLVAAFAAPDDAAAEAVLGDRLEVVDHRWHTTYGRDGFLESRRQMLRAQGADLHVEPIATLGDFLSLHRTFYSATGSTGGRFDVGENATEFVNFVEVDRTGQMQRYESFAADRLHDAITRLYQRYAELPPDGPARERAAATARSVAVWNGPIDPDRLATVMAPSIENADHRSLGTWSARGREENLRHWRLQEELAAGWALRDDAVLALEPNAFLVRRAYFGTVRSTGGAFENLLLALMVFGSDGLLARVEVWEPGREADALARFEEIAGGGAAETPFEPFANAASRSDSELFRCFNGRDWEGVLACVAPVMVFDERRRLVRNTCGREIWLEQFRFLFDVPKSRFTSQLRATRGERLALNFHRFEGEVAEGGGPLAMEDHLALHEVDGDGRIVGLVLFDLEDEVAAHAELDARFEAGEGAAHPLPAWGHHRRAIEARDWEAFAAATAPDFAYRDHRLLGWGTTVRDVATFVRVMQSAIDLAPDSRYRKDHVRLSERGHLSQATLLGTREGGAFESPMLRVSEFDELGRIRGFDTYDLEDLDRARARFEEIAAPVASAARFENTASRTWREVIAVWRQRDLERFAALHPPAVRYRDHRRLVQLDLDRDGFLAFTRPLLEMRSSSASLDLLATRGERLALMRSTLEMADDSVGPSAIDSLLLIETDEHGAIAAYDRYEIDDEEAARAEIQARWEAGEGAAHAHAAAWDAGFDAAVDRRDWDAAATFFAPAFVGRDHRLVSWGTLHGPAGFLVAVQTLVELAPDVRVRTQHLRASSRALLLDKACSGTRDGGAFESPFVTVIELDGSGRATHMDNYDPHHLERALARFAEIGAGEAASPPAASAESNEATAAIERMQAAFETGIASGDWDPVRSICAAGFVFDDRRRLALVRGDAELMIAAARERVAMGARIETRQLLGTAGERVAVERVLWAGGPSGGRFEIEYLRLAEVDEAGQLIAMIVFDLDDERAAQREAWARWAAIDPVAAPWVGLLAELTDAWNGRDRSRLRARFADDLVVEDHRHAGLGHIEGADAYVDSNVLLWELAPDQRLEFGWAWSAIDRHGIVVTLRREGTLPDGGAFESEYVWLVLARGGRITRGEFFEPDALGEALARFEALCAAAEAQETA